MAGYSGKPLVEKIGIKAGHRVALLDAPDGFAAELEPLPADVELVGPRAARTNVAILFSRQAARLEKAFSAVASGLADGGMLWVAWPKKAAKQQTDLTEDVVRRIGLAAGLVDVKVCAVNDVWSGLKFLRRRVPR